MNLAMKKAKVFDTGFVRVEKVNEREKQISPPTSQPMDFLQYGFVSFRLIIKEIICSED